MHLKKKLLGIWKSSGNNPQNPHKRSVAVFPDAAISMEVVWFGAFTLDTGTIHGSDAAQLVVRETPATQTRLRTCEERKKRRIQINT